MSHRQQIVKKMRDEEKLTFTQIGERLGIPRQRAHQIYNFVPTAKEKHRLKRFSITVDGKGVYLKR